MLEFNGQVVDGGPIALIVAAYVAVRDLFVWFRNYRRNRKGK